MIPPQASGSPEALPPRAHSHRWSETAGPTSRSETGFQQRAAQRAFAQRGADRRFAAPDVDALASAGDSGVDQLARGQRTQHGLRLRDGLMLLAGYLVTLAAAASVLLLWWGGTVAATELLSWVGGASGR